MQLEKSPVIIVTLVILIDPVKAKHDTTAQQTSLCHPLNKPKILDPGFE